MRFMLIRMSSRGIARYCSAYLLSAFLVLLGGFLSLHDESGRLIADEMRHVFATQLAYQGALLLVLGFLYRARRQVRDAAAITCILGVFIVDGSLVQHFHGWEPGFGLSAAALGGFAGLLVLAVMARILELSPFSRLIGTFAAVIVFVRFGPALLRTPSGSVELDGGYTLLGWLLAACLLPSLLFQPTDRPGSPLPLRVLERWGIGWALFMAVVHFVVAGEGLAQPFRLAYMAPFFVVLPLVLEAFVPRASRLLVWRFIVGGLPFVGLALSASSFAEGMTDWRWARAWPLTPFTLTLLLVVAVLHVRAVRDDSPWLRAVAGGLLSLAVLGGDLPEILVRACFPSAWQVVAVTVITWCTLASTRHVASAVLAQALPAFVVASWLGQLGYPVAVAYVVALAAGTLLLEPLTGWVMPTQFRLALAGTATLVPVAVALFDLGFLLELAVAAACCAVLVLVGSWRRDRLLWQVAAMSAAIGAVGYPLALQQRWEVSLGDLVMQSGFVVLLVAFLNSVLGNWAREQWLSWWDEDAPTSTGEPALGGEG